MTSTAPPAQLAGFTDAATSACTALSLPTPVLVRLGSAVLYRSGPCALRVTGPELNAAAVAAMGRLAHWLNGHEVPTIGTSEVIADHSGYTVAVSDWLEADRVATAAETGTLAAACHRVPLASWMPPFDPLAATRPRLRTLEGAGLSRGERALLHETHRQAEAAVVALAGSDRVALVHGDLTDHNILYSAGVAWLHDLESAGCGHPWWDLARYRHASLRFTGAYDWDEYASGYRTAGGDVPGEEDLAQLLVVTDLIGVVWALAGRALDPDRFATQARIRLASLEAGRTLERSWAIL